MINRNVLKTELIETLRVSYNGIFNYEQIIVTTSRPNSCCSILFELPARLHTHIGVFHHRNMDNHVSFACFDPFHFKWMRERYIGHALLLKIKHAIDTYSSRYVIIRPMSITDTDGDRYSNTAFVMPRK